jgi:branched-chain amino acid aminotransferase
MNAEYLWFNGTLQKKDSSARSILDHGLHYGTGVFEGIRCYKTEKGPAVFRLDAHLERLLRGGRLLGMELDAEELRDAIFQTLEANGHGNAYIRPIAYYGAGGLGLDVDPLKMDVAVATMPWKSHLGEAGDTGVRLTVSPFQRISSGAIPPAKLCGVYVNSVMAKLESRRRGFDEALFVDGDGMVCECTGENVFAVFGGEVVAVSHPDALDGITRASVIEMASAEERAMTLKELLTADEVFLTGTSAEIAAVSELDGRVFGPGMVTKGLQALYQDVVHGRSPDHAGWLSCA